MEYTYKIIDTEKYKLYDKFKNGIFEYRAINPTNNDKRNNHNSFFAKRALWSEDLHLGEFLSDYIVSTDVDTVFKAIFWFMYQFKRPYDLYPMFDNEMILGFDDDISYSKTLSNEKLSYSYEDIKRSSAIVTPDEMINNKNSVNYKKLFTFLLNRYPIQTQNALDKFKNFDISNLYEILNSLPDLTENRKNFALKLFDCRSKSLEEIYKNNKKIQKEINYR